MESALPLSFRTYGRLPGVIAKRSIVDIPTALIALATIVLLWKFRKLQEPVVIAVAAVIGLILFPILHA